MTRPLNEKGHENRESILRSGFLLDGLEELAQRGYFALGGVDNRPPFLERRCRPAFVFNVYAAVAVDINDGRVHWFDKESHQTPAAAEARMASSTPRMRAEAAPYE